MRGTAYIYFLKHTHQTIQIMIARYLKISALVLLLVQSLSLNAEEEKVSLNFVNADIESVIKAVGQISGKTFIIDPRVKGVINIASANPIPPGMAYQVLLSALRTQGFTAVEGNGVTTILPEGDAKSRYINTVGANSKVGGDQIVTQVFMIKYESANTLVPILKPMLSPNNLINAYPNNNMLIVTDYAENLRKIAKLLNTIDKPAAVENEIVKVKYANAVELSQTILKLVDNVSADPTRKMVVVSDARSNSIILKSDNIGQINRAKQLIEQLDTPSSSGSSIHVVYLRNADAKKLASTLQALTSSNTDLFSQQNNSQDKNAPNTTTSAANMVPAPSITSPSVQPVSVQNSYSNQPNNDNSLANPSSMIQADTATNSLIITAPDHVFNMLRGVIDKLDIRRAQLYIEALVAEVTTDKTSEFGIQWQDIQNLESGSSSNLRGFSGTKFSSNGASITSVAQNIGNASNGLNLGVLRGQINVPGLGTITNLGVLAHALESDANGNILSKPNLLTLDNEEAKIVIGQNVPFITGQYAQTGGAASVTPFQTIERKDVGLTLKVKPQISESDTIKLQIYQEVSSVSDTANSAGITTNKRSIETSVMVDDGNIIVLGGLIEDRQTETVNKVPVLGNIPVVGNLFKTQGRGHKKTNLMVFLRPYVMRDANASSTITNDRYQYIRNQEELASPKPGHWVLPDYPTVKMPEVDDKFYNKPQFEKELNGTEKQVPSASSSQTSSEAKQRPVKREKTEDTTVAPTPVRESSDTSVKATSSTNSAKLQDAVKTPPTSSNQATQSENIVKASNTPPLTKSEENAKPQDVAKTTQASTSKENDYYVTPIENTIQ